MNYTTRREWLLVEMVIGFISIATGISALLPGQLSAALHVNEHWPWALWFIGTGLVLLTTSFGEMVYRSVLRSECVSTLYRLARARMFWHGLNGLGWVYAFATLLESDQLVASIMLQSVPLIIFNVWGAFEHAKALWLDKSRCYTTSLFRLGFDRIRGSRHSGLAG